MDREKEQFQRDLLDFGWRMKAGKAVLATGQLASTEWAEPHS
ncbi:Uncharacterised protein [Pseudomonas fluorescens]|uniref:Uncharacterized protein n=1 Tax=Pseudomonas fluorescens TaxID=294 RepID=A0A448DJM9_PSEFL|nr:Uncharacterised protein [Pseudomonas fluorescens]